VKKSDVVEKLLQTKAQALPPRDRGMGFAPTNIALCKYWGKRDTELNLPMTSSISIALPDKGAMTTLTVHDAPVDVVTVNDQLMPAESSFSIRTAEYLDLFRPAKNWHLKVDIKADVPIAAGLASSACGFASLVSALNELFDWKLPHRQLSILARLGSGSASRSLWKGFVEWHAGVQSDGMDSFAEPLAYEWQSLCMGLLLVSEAPKAISSRDAMQRTIDSSILYSLWPKKVKQDLTLIKQALKTHNFSLLGGTAESNAMTMHATMMSAWPPICYYLPETIAAMQKVWELRKNGVEVYFTQDAGPNLKLLFLADNASAVRAAFPEMETIVLFD
jgi:diphosphomevalonate decarboxylase